MILINTVIKSSPYFECEKWATEACRNSCLNPKDCSGKTETAHGYYLRCLRCIDKDHKQI